MIYVRMYRINYLGTGFKSGDTSLEGLDDGGLFLDGRNEESGEAIVGDTLGAILIGTRGDDRRDHGLDFLGNKAKLLAGGIEVDGGDPVVLDGAEGLDLGKSLGYFHDILLETSVRGGDKAIGTDFIRNTQITAH
jgi:hypothetical protein